MRLKLVRSLNVIFAKKSWLEFLSSCIYSKIVELMLQNCRAQWQVQEKQSAICRLLRFLHLLFLSTNQTMASSC